MSSEVMNLNNKKDSMEVPLTVNVRDSLESNTFENLKKQSESFVLEDRRRTAMSPAPVHTVKSPFMNYKFSMSPFLTDRRKLNNVTPLVNQVATSQLSPMKEVENYE